MSFAYDVTCPELIWRYRLTAAQIASLATSTPYQVIPNKAGYEVGATVVPTCGLYTGAVANIPLGWASNVAKFSQVLFKAVTVGAGVVGPVSASVGVYYNLPPPVDIQTTGSTFSLSGGGASFTNLSVSATGPLDLFLQVGESITAATSVVNARATFIGLQISFTTLPASTSDWLITLQGMY